MKFFRPRKSPRRDTVDEDGQSLGSELSPRDQFDILIPQRMGSWNMFGDSSTVSSLTTDEHRSRRHRGSYFDSTNPSIEAQPPAAATNWCCCSCATDNTLDTNKTVSLKTLSGEGTIQNDKKWMACCPSTAPTQTTSIAAATSEVKIMRQKIPEKAKEVASLFDSLSDEEENDHHHHHHHHNNKQSKETPKRRWRPTLFRKLSWKKKNQQGEGGQDPSTVLVDKIPPSLGVSINQ